MYSFERNDRSSFAYLSRVYDVFEGDDRTSPILSLVIGYDNIMKRYFICYLAVEPFNSIYGHYPDRSIDTWQEVINEFVILFENAFEKTDLIKENHYNEIEIEKMPELTRNNLLYYTGSCDYDEIRELPIVIDEEEYVVNTAIEKKYLIPAYYESDDCSMIRYTPDDFMQYIIDEEYTESIYFTVDFNKIAN